MKYKVKFSQRVTQDETNVVIVEANSEKEARNKISNYDYDDVEICDANVISVDNLNITSVEEVDE